MSEQGLKSNPFHPLFEMFGDDADQIAELFESAKCKSAGECQRQIIGLAMLLYCLDSLPQEGDVPAIHDVSILRYMTALQAAYQLGANAPALASSEEAR